MNDIELRRRAGQVPEMTMTAMRVQDRGGSANQRRSLLSQYIALVRRRKYVIIGFTVALVAIALVATLLMTRQYTATGTLEIRRESRSFINIAGAQPEGNALDMEFYETQYGLLQAKSLADRIATEMRLYDNVEFFRMFAPGAAQKWFEGGRVKASAPSRDDRIRAAGGLLLKHVAVVPVRLSSLVNISFESPNPEFSKRVVDAWGANFIQENLQRRFDATSYARKFLETRLAQLRARIDESERNLVGYAAREGIVNLPAAEGTNGQGGGAERSLVADDLVSLNEKLIEARAERVRQQARLIETPSASVEALTNSAISTMRQRRAELSSEYAKMMVQFEPGYPPAVALKRQIDELDTSLSREESRVRTSIRQAYKASVQRENALQAQVNGLKTGVLDLRRRSIQYNIYKRDADTNQQLYDALLQRYKEIGVAGGVGVNNISVVNNAELPKTPSSPKLLLNLLAALVVGLGLGAAAAFALEQIFEGISDPSEVEEMLNLPLLGTVPKVLKGSPVDTLLDRKSALSEAYLTVQTSLSFSSDHGVPRSLAVTSSRPAEGKSTTSFAIAQSLARANKRVVLVDGDLRSPSLHFALERGNEIGLSNYLAGSDDLDAMIGKTKVEGLQFISAGPQPPSAAELLSSERLVRFIEELTRRFDHVVLDIPPVMGLADAPLVASRVEATVFVVEFQATKTSLARMAIGRLYAANAQIVGIVLSKFNVRQSHFGYDYDYGYGYGHQDRA